MKFIPLLLLIYLFFSDSLLCAPKPATSQGRKLSDEPNPNSGRCFTFNFQISVIARAFNLTAYTSKYRFVSAALSQLLPEVRFADRGPKAQDFRVPQPRRAARRTPRKSADVRSILSS